jgi:hypothetical protein
VECFTVPREHYLQGRLGSVNLLNKVCKKGCIIFSIEKAADLN